MSEVEPQALARLLSSGRPTFVPLAMLAHIRTCPERARFDAASAAERKVTRYAADMANGDRFPPIHLSTNGDLVDGQHRLTAARRVSLPGIDAVVPELAANALNGALRYLRQRVRDSRLDALLASGHRRGLLLPCNVDRLTHADVERHGLLPLGYALIEHGYGCEGLA